MAVLWVFYASLGALDGSQVALVMRGTFGWRDSVREGLEGVVWRMERGMRVRGGQTLPSLEESTRLCRCGGKMRLVVDYVDVVREGRSVEMVGQEARVGARMRWVQSRLGGPLARGRRFASDASRSDARYCEKEVIVKYLVYYDGDGDADGGGLEAALLEDAEEGFVSLSLPTAARVHKRLHQLGSEYPADAIHRDGMHGHLVVVDVGGGRGLRLVSPTVGVVSGVDAIAVVDSTDENADMSVQVHEIDSWLYGSRLGMVQNHEEIERACAVEAKHQAVRLLKILDQARHLRYDPASDIWKLLDGNMSTSAFEVASALRTIVHSPEFGVEPRMPVMHVLALMLPLGLPLVLQFLSSIKLILTRGKKKAKKVE